MLGIRQDQRQVISQRIDPKLIMANAILQQNSLELEQQIRAELLENPALDVMEDAEPCKGDCIDPSACPFCSQQMEARRPETDSRDQMDVEPEYFPDSAQWESDEEYDPLGNLEAELTLQDHLRTQMRSALPETDHWIGDYLIENLDDNGWLAVEVDILAEELGVDAGDVCRVLKIVQSLDPPGIGAR